MNMIEEQIAIAKDSLEKRRRFESGWYEKRIAELEAQLAELRAEAAPPYWRGRK